MKKNSSLFPSYLADYVLPWVTLAILLLFTYAYHFETPFEGFHWDSQGNVTKIYVKDRAEPTLHVGDRLIQIGSVLWKDFQSDLHQQIFAGVQPGEVVPLVVERNGQRLNILWEYPGPTPGEVNDQLFSQGWLAFAFWGVGTLTLLSLRPKDERQKLLVAFNYLTAIWLVIGSGVSRYHIWNSAQLLYMGIWLSVPVYWHLHWLYPLPLGKLPRGVLLAGYLCALVIGLLGWFIYFPEWTLILGFLLAILGSFVLLVLHAVLRPQDRADLRLLIRVAVLALVPSIVIGFVGSFSTLPTGILALSLVSLPLLPFAYLYTAFRRRLGGLEIRVNRLLSIYFFVVLLGALVLPVAVLAAIRVHATDSIILVDVGLNILTAVLAIFGFPHFQKFVERHWFGIHLPSENLLEIYSAQITASTSLEKLSHVLENEVMTSLLVRKFAFLRADGQTLKNLSAVNISIVPEEYEYAVLLELAGKYRSPETLRAGQPYPWVHLVLPLKVEHNVIGFWLFGRRDPDDYYSQVEISLLQSLANQTAIALSNILQTERLRAMYQANVDRYEEERLRLALDLHDSILNQLAVLQMNLDKPSQKFQEAYDGLTQRLREIVSDLRPPMLNYGLEPAIRELADNLMERSKDTIHVELNLQTDQNRYESKTELHLFRIVQEACENALRHAQARNIKIFGKLEAQEINLQLQDDGAGFELDDNSLVLDALITQKHFGLAGMQERASIIGAELEINSSPNAGTHIQITWKPGLATPSELPPNPEFHSHS
jgi:signal transduction histidine kinase